MGPKSHLPDCRGKATPMACDTLPQTLLRCVRTERCSSFSSEVLRELVLQKELNIIEKHLM